MSYIGIYSDINTYTITSQWFQKLLQKRKEWWSERRVNFFEVIYANGIIYTNRIRRSKYWNDGQFLAPPKTDFYAKVGACWIKEKTV